MTENEKATELIESFEELQKKALETYPTLQETLETYNSARIITEDYLNFMNLLRDNPLPTASNNSGLP